MNKFRFNNKILKKRRRELRFRLTDAETKLWGLIRNRQINGFKFLRQYSAGPYILDFYCPRLRLAIELDGSGHSESEQVLYDRDRAKYLEALNIICLRFWNHQVLNDEDNVLDKILSVINSRV
ncbi:MAG: DUF559 domain-containing protein [Patescibacteria group bacterium]